MQSCSPSSLPYRICYVERVWTNVHLKEIPVFVITLLMDIGNFRSTHTASYYIPGWTPVYVAHLSTTDPPSTKFRLNNFNINCSHFQESHLWPKLYAEHNVIHLDIYTPIQDSCWKVLSKLYISYAHRAPVTHGL